MIDKKHNLFKFSLRSKMIIMLALVVISVSLILLYFSSSMILKDKQAYLFDSSFSNVEVIANAFDDFAENKNKLVNAYLQSPPDKVSEIAQLYSGDSDLFQVRVLKAWLPDEIGPEGNPLERSFVTEKDKKEIDKYTMEEFLAHQTQSSVVFTSDLFFKKYKNRLSFILAPMDTINKKTLLSQREDKTIKSLHYEEGIAPRLLIIKYRPEDNLIYCFDFFLDSLVEKFIYKTGFENTLVNSKGDDVFHNQPQDLLPIYNRFYRNFIQGNIKISTELKQSGVREERIGTFDYIIGFKRLKSFPELFVFSGIKTSEAYEVTTILIANTLVYVFLLIGSFNIFSIYLARTITNPIDQFIEVIETIANGKYNVRVGTQNTSELQSMAGNFNLMVDKIQDYNQKLLEYNRTLEQKVEERTEKLRKANNFITTMVDSLAQGLLVFDKSGVCLDLYTKACEKLLGSSPANQQLSRLLKAEDKELLTEWLKSLFEEMIPFESLVELGPKSLPTIKDYHLKDFKHVTLEFYPMRNDEGRIENVVMVATDKTREYKTQKQIIEEQNYVKLVTKVIKDKRNFLRFVDLFETSMQKEASQIKESGQFLKNDFMRLLHSMKGLSAFYAFTEVVVYLHEFETEIEKDGLDKDDVLLRIDQVLDVFHETIHRLKDFIGENKDHVVEIPERLLREFYFSLSVSSNDSALFFSKTFLEAPVEKYLYPYKELVSELALKLGKKIHPLIVENGNVAVDINYYQSFFDSCIHLFRNCVDHGIETSDLRIQKGKPGIGTIKVLFDIEVADLEKVLVFHLQDDGAGLDPDRIRRKMGELGYPADQLNESDHEIIHHIFDSSFSTADSVTEISGRGVGLFDIKEKLRLMGGSVELVSQRGKGTLFSFRLPIPSNGSPA